MIRIIQVSYDEVLDERNEVWEKKSNPRRHIPRYIDFVVWLQTPTLTTDLVMNYGLVVVWV